jgi:hypothetical protein
MKPANDDRYAIREAYFAEKEARLSERGDLKVVRLELIDPPKRESPYGVAILAVLGLLVGSLVGLVL